MNRLAIIGAGDLGQLIAYHAINDSGMELSGFFDDTLPKGEKAGLGKVLGSVNDIGLLLKKDKFDQLIIGIGYKHMNRRAEIFLMRTAERSNRR